MKKIIVNLFVFALSLAIFVFAFDIELTSNAIKAVTATLFASLFGDIAESAKLTIEKIKK